MSEERDNVGCYDADSDGVSDTDDDDTDDGEEEEEENADGRAETASRVRRDVTAVPLYSGNWCGTSGYSTDWTDLGTSENPVFGTRMMLFSRTNYHIAVFPNGKVRGIMEDRNKYAVFDIIPAGFPGHVRIFAVETNLYIAMNSKGRVYTEDSPDNTTTVFIERLVDVYNTYLSKAWAHRGWYLAIKKSGRPKNGRKTSWKQNGVHFLPNRTAVEDYPWDDT